MKISFGIMIFWRMYNKVEKNKRMLLVYYCVQIDVQINDIEDRGKKRKTLIIIHTINLYTMIYNQHYLFLFVELIGSKTMVVAAKPRER